LYSKKEDKSPDSRSILLEFTCGSEFTFTNYPE